MIFIPATCLTTCPSKQNQTRLVLQQLTARFVLFWKDFEVVIITYVILNSRESNICLYFCHYFSLEWGYFKDIEDCILRVVFREMKKSKVDGKYFIIVMCSIV